MTPVPPLSDRATGSRGEPVFADDADEQRLRHQLEAYHVCALVYTAAKLGVADRIGSGAVSAEQLAGEMALSPPHLLRFLRALSAVGICEELPDSRFALTLVGGKLRSDSSSGLAERAIIAAEQYWRPWTDLAYSLQTGRPAFDQVFGMPVWDWRKVNTAQGAMFQSWTAKACARQAEAIVEVIDLGDVRIVADIGGGSGALLAELLTAHPEMSGILFDQPQAVASARPLLRDFGVAERVQCVGGDFLAPFAVQADLYLLKSVLHDWDDREAHAILNNCRGSMSDKARIVIIEDLLPARALDDPATILLDLHMMVVTGGRERSLEEIDALLSRSGLTLLRAVPTRIGLWVIEATRR